VSGGLLSSGIFGTPPVMTLVRVTEPPVSGGLLPASVLGSVEVGGRGDVPPVAGGVLPSGILGTSATWSTGTRASPPRAGLGAGTARSRCRVAGAGSSTAAASTAARRLWLRRWFPRPCLDENESPHPATVHRNRPAASSASSISTRQLWDPGRDPRTNLHPTQRTTMESDPPCTSRMCRPTDCLALVQSFTLN